jgi:hypothetical protein
LLRASSLGGGLDGGNVDALHAHHRLEDPFRAGSVLIRDQARELDRNDLP